MLTVHVCAQIQAPIHRVFRLSTRIELVQRTLGMKLAGELQQGHITAHSRVHWSGWKFGLPTHHHTLITGFTAPHTNAADETVAWFQDSQERGRFAFFQHDHFFRESRDADGCAGTLVSDEICFSLPCGTLGVVAAKYVMAPHIRRLARQRFALIKSLAEGEGWREWV